MYSLTIVLTEVHACPLYTFVSARKYILCTLAFVRIDHGTHLIK